MENFEIFFHHIIFVKNFQNEKKYRDFFLFVEKNIYFFEVKKNEYSFDSEKAYLSIGGDFRVIPVLLHRF